ncbi:MAG: 1-deoxy-D-xylulose 5-phosphate reductoisomerase [Alphaproteobacteria bacterium MarineAlpha9_Bin7]|nr:MAG: 1-deoxy-D-xylulose 5-phosphate reductoisomerase [Alphaproteobacteria bacterium MarineAlpha9_Bin7]
MAVQGFKPVTLKARRVTVLGSTGSVGCNTVAMLERDIDQYEIEALTARANVKLLAEQARRLKPKIAVVSDVSRYQDLKIELAGSGVEAAAGIEAVVEAASLPTDWVMAAIVGTAGLAPTLAAIRHGGVVALANKECLVSAGGLFTKEVKKYDTDLLPVDSEHNGIFQVFDFKHPEGVEKIVLTASGGPFRSMSRQQMRDVTPEQAVAHPNWDMGRKISIDSATMMNKGLEIIEAFHLFPVKQEQIEIVVHPQSVVHSMVAYRDGSVLAQLGVPDMRVPIAFTLAWPNRFSVPVRRLDLAKLGKLTFEAPSEGLFPALRLAREVLLEGGSAPAVMNAANEIAVEGFLDRRIGFLEIVEIVERTLNKLQVPKADTIEEISEVDKLARKFAKALLPG